MGISRQELQSTFSKQAVCTKMHYLCYVLFTKTAINASISIYEHNTANGEMDN